MESAQRLLVVGLPASGKTTLAAAVAARRAVPHIEVDQLYFGPGWSVNPDYLDLLRQQVQGPAWCVDDVGYPESEELLWARADALVWLDLPQRLVVQRAVRRTAGRLRRREEALPGCRESPVGWLRLKHPVMFTLTRYRRHRQRVLRRLRDPRYAHLQVAVLRSPAEVEAFLDRLLAADV